ncbi:MAG: hypothetical protein SGPRY_008419, partial [Prymnesium sp.]
MNKPTNNSMSTRCATGRHVTAAQRDRGRQPGSSLPSMIPISTLRDAQKLLPDCQIGSAVSSDRYSCTVRFTLQAAVQHATPLAFETLHRHIDDLKHVAMHGDFENFEKMKERFEAKLAAKSELDHRALARGGMSRRWDVLPQAAWCLHPVHGL